MKRIIILAVLSLFGGIVMAQTAKQKVAVYVTGDAEAGYKKVVGSKLVTGITRSDDYAAVERTADFLNELTKEQDYQMSGAVSDNQIARLGQQFGVRYVLVADVSEVFESMFISARMIDVQTAQITNSTEISQVVNNMESLTAIAENIVVGIMGMPIITEESIKLLGSYWSFDGLYSIKREIPEGYHIASKDEIENIIKSYQIKGKKLSFPIYTDITTSESDIEQPYTETKTYRNSNNKVLRQERINCIRKIPQYHVTCTFVDNSGKSSILTLSKIRDTDWSWYLSNKVNYENSVSEYSGVTNRSYTPTVTPGYVYVIKN